MSRRDAPRQHGADELVEAIRRSAEASHQAFQVNSDRLKALNSYLFGAVGTDLAPSERVSSRPKSERRFSSR